MVSLFKQCPCHPSYFIQTIVKPTHDRALSPKHWGFFDFPMKNRFFFLSAIWVACEGNSDPKLIGLLSTHLPLWEPTIWWSKCKECRLINIPWIFWLKSSQKFLNTSLFHFDSCNINWTCFPMLPNLLELVPIWMWATISPVQFTHTVLSFTTRPATYHRFDNTHWK